MKKNKHRSISVDASFRVASITVSVIFGIYALSLLYPIVWAFLMSLKTPKEYLTNSYGFPSVLNWSNYASALTALRVGDSNLFVMIFNSIWYSVGNSLINVVVIAITAYACAKYDFFLGKVCYWCTMVMLMLPIASNLAGQFSLAEKLGTYDSPWSLIASAGGLGMDMLIARAVFKGIDKSYSEAAYIDGASHWQIFVKINLPLGLPPLLATFMTGFMGRWNDTTGPLLFLPSYPTVSSGLYIYQNESMRLLNYPVFYAGLLMTAIPSVIIYLLLHKNIFSIKVGGALKG